MTIADPAPIPPAAPARQIQPELHSRRFSYDWATHGAVTAQRFQSATDHREDTLHIKTEGDFAIHSPLRDGDLSQIQEAGYLTFKAFHKSSETMRIDVLGYEADKSTYFWRKVTIEPGGWQTIQLPLCWFRWAAGRVPDWAAVQSLGFRGSAGVDLWIGDIAFIDRPDGGAAAAATETDYVELMASVSSQKNLRSYCDDDLWLFTDCDQLDAERLREHLRGVRAHFLEKMGIDHPHPTPPKMFVFQEKGEYQQFAIEAAAMLNASTSKPSCDGLHLQGLALSSYVEGQGSLRSVFTHEFVHSLCSHYARLDPASGDWMQEGIATWFQCMTDPQAGLSKIVLDGLNKESFRWTLEKLTTDPKLPLKRYWQAMTLVDYFMNAPEVAAKWPELLKAVRNSGKTDLSHHLTTVYEMDFEELEKSWMDYTRRSAGKYEPVGVEMEMN